MKIALIVFLLIFICFILYLIWVGARTEHFWKAAIEMFVIYVISNMPIIFLVLASLYNVPTDNYESLTLNIKNVLNGGDAFIYISAILAPVVWALIAYFRDSHRALAGFYLMTLILILPFSAFSFQQARLAESINQDALDNTALLLYCVSLMLWYGAVVYTQFIDSYEPSESGNSVLDGLRGAK